MVEYIIKVENILRLIMEISFYTSIVLLTGQLKRSARPQLSDLQKKNVRVFALAAIIPACIFIYYFILGFIIQDNGTLEQYAILNRMFGPYWYEWWVESICVVIIPQLLWIKKISRIISICLILQFLVVFYCFLMRWELKIFQSHRDYIVSSDTLYFPTAIEILQVLIEIAIYISLLYVWQRRMKRS